MVKQTLFFVLTLLFSNLASSEIKVIESSSIKSGLKVFVSSVCIDGYKFVIADGTVQFFEIKNKQIVPARCDMK